MHRTHFRGSAQGKTDFMEEVVEINGIQLENQKRNINLK